MPLRLAQRMAAEELAQKIFKWEVMTEEHAAVLRSDPNQLAEVYTQCAVNTPPVGSFPPRDQLAGCIAKAELDLQIAATTFSERLTAISNCLFLCRATMMLAAEDDYAVFLEMKRKAFRLTAHLCRSDQHPYDTSQTELASPRRPQMSTPAANDHQLQYPTALPARSLTFDEIGNAARVEVTTAAYAGYRRNYDHLLNEIFVSESSEGIEAFRVSSILITENQERLFYLVFAGEGPEAVCHSLEDFFALLSTSARLLLSP
ncbi:hypothetical protein B0H14DRAFT_2830952 [Mycena olivaceomarginata]|nr:hypothetical protein B0H14DRAFT_2830952 [Mycena olivaceomarginata]